MSETTTPEEIEANVLKLRAEAAYFAAQTRKEEAEADLAEANATKAAIDLDEYQDEYAKCQVSDYNRRIIRFEQAVDASSVRSCIRTLEEWDQLDPECDIEIVFLSPGGSVIHGMALFDELTKLSLRGGGKHKVTCGAQGYAASMAGILLQAGDHRWIGAQSYLMIHEISAGSSGKIGEIQDSVKFYEAVCSRVADIFVKRSDGKCSKAKFTKGWVRTDWWLLSDDALKLGFVDEIR